MYIRITALNKPGEIKKWMQKIADDEATRITARLAEMAEISIKTWIMNTSHMPTGKLADAFSKEQISQHSWGVGNIPNLNSDVPYWKHVNFGSEGISANWQHFLPKGYWDESGRWVEDANGYYGIKPNTPIQAHNYIEKTILDMDMAIQQVLKEK